MNFLAELKRRNVIRIAGLYLRDSLSAGHAFLAEFEPKASGSPELAR